MNYKETVMKYTKAPKRRSKCRKTGSTSTRQMDTDSVREMGGLLQFRVAWSFRQRTIHKIQFSTLKNASKIASWGLEGAPISWRIEQLLFFRTPEAEHLKGSAQQGHRTDVSDVEVLCDL